MIQLIRVFSLMEPLIFCESFEKMVKNATTKIGLIIELLRKLFAYLVTASYLNIKYIEIFRIIPHINPRLPYGSRVDMGYDTKYFIS